MSSKNGNRDGVVEHRRRDGAVVYSVRFRDAAGRQHQERVGTSVEGWTRARAAQVCVQRRVDVQREGLRLPKREQRPSQVSELPDEPRGLLFVSAEPPSHATATATATSSDSPS
jgi:hypothetical protein